MANVFLHDQSESVIGDRGANASLTVHCPSGSSVTVKRGSIERSGVSDASGKAVFNGLSHGVWTVTISKGYQTTTQDVEIVTNYDTVATIFSATLVIDYPEGSYCTVITPDGNIDQAPDKSGVWEYEADRIGTFVVSCTNGNQTATKEIEVETDGQNVDVLLAYFKAFIHVTYPAGAFCTVTDDISTTIATSDTTGVYTFEIPHTNKWRVHVTDGVQFKETEVVISEDGQSESIEFKFFKVVTTITYPEGAKCTLTDGVKTFEAPDSGGTWVMNIPWAALWSITAINGNEKASERLDVLEEDDGTAKTVTLKFFEATITVTYPQDSFKIVLNQFDEYNTKTQIAEDTSKAGSYNFTVTKAGKYEVVGYRVAPYSGIESEPGDYVVREVTITTDGDRATVDIVFNTIPDFEYNGEYQIVDDGNNSITTSNKNWNIIFKSGGKFRLTDLHGANAINIEVTCVGGGGRGGIAGHTNVQGVWNFYVGGGGGGGGEVKSASSVKLTEGYETLITIGGESQSTSAFGVTANPGQNGSKGTSSEGAGGAGGGNTGGAGGYGGATMGPAEKGKDGQLIFGGLTGLRYGPGGAGGYGYNQEWNTYGTSASGGKDGGGASNSNATAYSGGGGGGGSAYRDPGKGACGIVMIRNKR